MDLVRCGWCRSLARPQRGPCTWRGSSLSSSPLNWRGRGLVPCAAAHLALCFCCCRAGASCSCGWRRCPQFHSSLLGMEQVSMPSASETTQQPTRPGQAKGTRPPRFASPSPPPVQCTIPNPLAFFLIPVLLTGRKGGDLYRHAHRIFEGRPGLQRADPAPSKSLSKSQRPEDEGHAHLPAGLVPLRTLSQPSLPHLRPPQGRPSRSSRKTSISRCTTGTSARTS